MAFSRPYISSPENEYKVFVIKILKKREIKAKRKQSTICLLGLNYVSRYCHHRHPAWNNVTMCKQRQSRGHGLVEEVIGFPKRACDPRRLSSRTRSNFFRSANEIVRVCASARFSFGSLALCVYLVTFGIVAAWVVGTILTVKVLCYFWCSVQCRHLGS